ncbi:MAG: sugar ABC transporter ATP-binding protein [Planctomycetota bacterium]|jgi:ribose transport system ATP-binding protein
MTTDIIQCHGIGKSFFGVPVLQNASFRLPAGRVLGIVGENGAGKSTLMNILGGVIQPDTGRILLNGDDYAPKNPLEAQKNRIAFIHQELNLFTNLSIAENLFIGNFPSRPLLPAFIDKKVLYKRAAALLEIVGLDVSPDMLVEELSPGLRQLVEIARALSMEARIFIFDEPTTSLTSTETERLFELIRQMRKKGFSIIYISHALEDVLNLSDDILILRDGEMVGSGPKADFTVERLVSLMVGRTIEELYPARTASRSTEVRLDVENLSQAGMIHDVSFQIHAGEVVGLFGLLGSGRTELSQMIFGLEPFETGTIRVNDKNITKPGPRERIRSGLAYLTENRREEGLLFEANITDNISLVALPSITRLPLGTVNKTALRRAVSGMVDSIQLRYAHLDRQPVRTLSGGNQQKVILARWLLNNPSVIILDQPTRGIDVGAKHEIYKMINQLADRGTGILLISSEVEELMGMCDRILIISTGQIRNIVDKNQFDREFILRAALRESGLQQP